MSDTKITLLCPACHEEMKKVFLPHVGFNVDICLDGCGGIYLDNRELQSIDEQNENIDAIINELKDKEFNKIDEEAVRYCPSCGAKMVKNATSILKNFQIDECYSCGGKFFDYGELCSMREEYENDEQRTKAVIDSFLDVHGLDLSNQKLALEQAKQERSKFRKLLHAWIDKTANSI